MIDAPDGFRILPGYFDRAAQRDLVGRLRVIAGAAPFFQPRMPRTGKPFSVEMTNCGPLGWVADRDGGYRYQPTHPESDRPWPAMPAPLTTLWHAVADYPQPPEACLINHYRPGTRMGLHVDADEEDFAAPVVSVSLGDDCRFRIGGTVRKAPTRSIRLGSGDVVVLGGAARRAYHGVDRIYPETSALLRDWFPEGGRINLTLRRVTRPTSAGLVVRSRFAVAPRDRSDVRQPPRVEQERPVRSDRRNPVLGPARGCFDGCATS